MLVRGIPAVRPTTMVVATDPISLAEPEARFVSRGGEKLDGALASFGLDVAGRRWVDLGASTGGFTDRLLQGGAAEVAAVDVGYGQLHWKLRNDPRVHVIERTNARELRAGDLPFVPEGVTADLSFISLTVVLPALVDVADRGADYVLLVKPQFEVGKAAVGKGGVVRDPELWRSALQRVAEASQALGLGVAGAAASKLRGPAGNREFFLHLRADVTSDRGAIDRAVAEV